MGWWKNIMKNGKTWRDVSLFIQTAPCVLRRKNDKLEAELFLIRTIHKRDDFLGLISIQGIVRVILNDQSHFRRVKAYQHVHGVRTAGSQRLEMPQEGCRYSSLPFTMNGNEERYLLPKHAKNIAITRYRCAVINSYSEAFCFSHDFHCRKLY